MKPKSRIEDLIQYGIFLLLILDIPYVQHIFGHLFPVHFVLEVALIIIIAATYFRGGVISIPVCLMLVFMLYILFATVMFEGSVRSYSLDFFSAAIVCFYFHLINLRKGALEKALRQWIIFFLVIVIIDLITIILVPKGLYLGSDVVIGSSKNKNWILGYKTNRLKYSFPLLVFYTYHWFNKNTFRLIHLLTPAIVLADIYLSGGSAGTVVVLLYVVLSCIMIYSARHKGTAFRFFSRLLEQYWLFFIVFAIVQISMVIVQNNSVLYTTLMNIFSKSDTLGNRTLLWQNSLKDIAKHLWFGHGALHASQYSEITGGYINPHNIILSYLMTGGIVGLVLFILFIVSSFRHLKRSSGNFVFLLGIYCILILGITSSTLSFSPFLYAFFILIYSNKDSLAGERVRNRRIRK